MQRPRVGVLEKQEFSMARIQSIGQVGGGDVQEAGASPHRALWVTARHEGFILPAK